MIGALRPDGVSLGEACQLRSLLGFELGTLSVVEPTEALLAAGLSLCVAWLMTGISSADRARKWVVGSVICLLPVIIVGGHQASTPRAPDAPPLVAPRIGYATSKACRSCHPAQYQSWSQSYHSTMTQVATPATVRAPFDEVELRVHEVGYRLQRRAQEFWVTAVASSTRETSAPLPVIPLSERVRLITGSHHYQAFWAKAPGDGALHQLPFVFLLDDGRFIPRDAAFLQPPDAARKTPRWNSNCIQCHSVAGRPLHDEQDGRYRSDVAELGIACEACHGPAAVHAKEQKNPLRRYYHRLSDAPAPNVVNPARLPRARGSEVCGQCHAYFLPRNADEWWTHGYSRSYRPGADLSESRDVMRYMRERTRHTRRIDATLESVFWADGSIRVGGREFNGLIESPCFKLGRGQEQLSCLSCHSMHDSDADDQLRRDLGGNEACTQCHETKVDVASHSHHAANSAGSLCYNCHMPRTSYALFKSIRSHRIDSPSAQNAVITGKPVACNLCHLDRTLAWTAKTLARWYGREAASVELTEADAGVAQAIVWLLQGDAAQRAIVADAMGWAPALAIAGHDWQAPHIAQLLDDPYAAVRRIAGRTLHKLPGFEQVEYDFLWRARERRAVRDRVLSDFARVRRGQPEREALLIDAEGRLDARRVAQLLAQRDTRRITISE